MSVQICARRDGHLGAIPTHCGKLCEASKEVLWLSYDRAGSKEMKLIFQNLNSFPEFL